MPTTVLSEVGFSWALVGQCSTTLLATEVCSSVAQASAAMQVEEGSNDVLQECNDGKLLTVQMRGESIVHTLTGGKFHASCLGCSLVKCSMDEEWNPDSAKTRGAK